MKIRNTNNKPYIKQYDEMGKLLNPISKNSPHLTDGMNRSQRRYVQPKHSKPSREMAPIFAPKHDDHPKRDLNKPVSQAKQRLNKRRLNIH